MENGEWSRVKELRPHAIKLENGDWPQEGKEGKNWVGFFWPQKGTGCAKSWGCGKEMSDLRGGGVGGSGGVGLVGLGCDGTQGVALGWYVAPRWG